MATTISISEPLWNVSPLYSSLKLCKSGIWPVIIVIGRKGSGKSLLGVDIANLWLNSVGANVAYYSRDITHNSKLNDRDLATKRFDSVKSKYPNRFKLYSSDDSFIHSEHLPIDECSSSSSNLCIIDEPCFWEGSSSLINTRASFGRPTLLLCQSANDIGNQFIDSEILRESAALIFEPGHEISELTHILSIWDPNSDLPIGVKMSISKYNDLTNKRSFMTLIRNTGSVIGSLNPTSVEHSPRSR